MGLHTGSETFRTYLPILKNAAFVPENDTSSTGPIFYGWDLMTHLTSAKGSWNWVNLYSDFGTPDRYVENKFGTLGNILTSVLSELNTFVKCHTHREEIVVVLACDSSSLVPPEKAREQAKRSRKQMGGTYEGNELKQVLQGSYEVEMYKLMATRPLRKHVFEYLHHLVFRFPWSATFKLFFEAQFSEVGPRAYEYSIFPNEPVHFRLAEHSNKGEGEMGILAWAMKYKRTHEIQLHSGDLDVLALCLLHGDQFQFDLKALLCRRFIFSFENSLPVLSANGLCPETVVLASLFLGTDFVEKSQSSFRAGHQVVFEGVKLWKEYFYQESGTFAQNLEETSPETWSRIFTVSNQFLKRKKVIDESIRSPLFDPQHELQSFKVVTTQTGMEQIRFNWRYWTTTHH